MAYVIGVAFLATVALLVFASNPGRTRVHSCCAVADPRSDLRMRAAFTGDHPADSGEQRLAVLQHHGQHQDQDPRDDQYDVEVGVDEPLERGPGARR